MRLSNALLVPIALATWACGGSNPAAPRERPPDYDFTPLTAAIQTALDTLPRADTAALILIQNGYVIYDRGFGGLSTDDPVPIASSSKWLTAATVLTLVDQGAVGLDVPMKQYLKSVSKGYWGDPRAHEITLRQMLSLTAGFQTMHPCIYRTTTTLQECAVDIGSFGLVADPGAAMWYGQATFQVAGAVVEDATGRSWRDIFEAGIAGPLGMTQTIYQGDGNPELGDGAVSTVHDYANFLRMIEADGVFQGRRVLSSRMIEEMTRDETHGVPILYTPRSEDLRYGLGVWRDVVAPDGRWLLISSPGSLGFWPWIDRRRNLIGVLAIPPHLSISGAIVGSVFRVVEEIVPVQDGSGS